MKQKIYNFRTYLSLFKSWGLILLLWLPFGMANAQNNALDFDGGTHYVEVPSLTWTPTTFTVEFWINPNTTINYNQTLRGSNGTNGWGTFVFSTTNTGAVYVGTDIATRLTPTEIPAGTIVTGVWQHIAFTHDGTNGRFYKNGVQIGPAKPMTVSVPWGGFNMGYSLAASTIDGALDEVRIWNTARTCEQINLNKDNGLLGTETGLEAYYNFNQGTAAGANAAITTLNDLTANDNDGTVTNFALTGATSNWITSGSGVTGTTPLNLPNINVQGNAVSITDGDGTPDVADNTNFGNVSVGNSQTVTYTIQNTVAGSNLSVASVVVSGANAADFVVSNFTNNTIVAGIASTTFDVTFTAPALGVRNATITVSNSDCDATNYDFAVRGTGATISNALDLDGTNDFVAIPDNPAFDIATAITIEAWVNTTTTTASYILSKGNTGAYAFYLSANVAQPNKAAFFLQGVSAAWLNSTTNINDGNWHHIVGTYDGTRMKIYVDGVEENSVASTALISTAGTSPILLGTRDQINTFDGQIDELRIWDIARTCEQINTNKDNELLGNEAGLVAYYNFNQGTAAGANAAITTLNDLTANNNDGTLTNMALSGTTSNWIASTNGVSGTTPSNLPNINVQGNSISITNGGITPNVADDTDFGSVTPNRTITYTIQNTVAGSNLTIANIAVSGLHASDFVVSNFTNNTIVAGIASTTFDITFTPSALGTRNATITINNNDCDATAYDFAVEGSSSAPIPLSIVCPGNVVLNTASGTCESVALKYYPTVTAANGNYNLPITGYTYLGNAPNGHSYYLSNGSANYLTARQAALDAGGHLAVIDDAAENTLIQSYVTANGLSYILIGYDDVDNEGTFEWYTGQATVYTNWRPGEPNDYGTGEDATTLQNNGGWNDLKSTVNHRYIVEVPGARTIQTTGLPTCSKFPVGVTTNTFVTTDKLGNTATCSFTVTVSDNDLPVITAKPDFTRNTDAGVCTFTNTASSITNGTASDNCGINSYSYVLTGATTGTVSTLAGQIFNGGITTVTWTAQDVNGNFSATTDVFTVTVNDNQIPVVTAKADETFIAPVGVCTFANTGGQITEGTGTDNCAITSYSYVLTGATTGTVTTLVGQVFNAGTTTVTWNAIDAAGNTSVADVFTVTITVDNGEINVRGNAVTIVDGDVSPSPVDNTDFGPVVNPSTNAVVYTIENTGTSDLTITSVVAASIDPTEFVVSGIATPVTINAGGSTTFTVTFVPNTTAGNKGAIITINNTDCDEAIYDFVVTGNVPAFVPTLSITCPSNVTVNTVLGTCESAAIKDYPVITGGIGNYSLPIAGFTYLGQDASNGHSYYLSSTTENYLDARQSALDAGGYLAVIDDAAENTLIQSYVVANGLSYLLIGYDDIDIEGTFEWYTGQTTIYTNWRPGEPNDSGGNEDATTIQDNGGWNDLPSTVNHRYIVEIPGAKTIQTTGLSTCSKFPVGVTTNTYVTTDMLGNTTTCSFTVTVNDNQVPVLTPKGNFIASANPVTCDFTNAGTLTDGIATDNCGLPSFTYILSGATTGTVSTLAGQTFNVGTTTVTWTATDASGNAPTSDVFDVIINNREIDVIGNLISIIDGDITPATNDDTDFGNVQTDKTVTYTIQNTGNLPLAITSITSDNVEFVVSNIPTTVAAASTATFDVTFTPTSNAVQTATIIINNNDCNEAVYDFAVRGKKPSPPTPTLPTAVSPTGFTATAVSTTQINLTWNSVTQNITEYYLYQGGVLIATLPVGTVSYQVTGLNPNTLYSFALVAVNRGNGQLRLSTPASARDWTFPEAPYLISIAQVCTAGNANVKVGSNLGSVYQVYDKITDGTLLLESINGSFELPYTNQDTVFYISVLGSGRVPGRERGYESARIPVSVSVADAFEAIILGESVQTSCENTLELVAQEVENASYYRWYLNDQPFYEGESLVTTISGRYKLSVRKGNCNVVSEEVLVKLNQKPIAQIQQFNNARFCTAGILSAAIMNANATYKWILNDAVIGEETSISVSQSGIYTLEVSQNGCQATSQIEVFISAIPQLPVLEATQTNICTNSETTLSVQNPESGVTYQWFRNGRNLRTIGNSFSTSIQGRYQVLAMASTNSSCSIFSEELRITRFGQRAIYLRVSQDKTSLFLEDLDGSQDEILNVEWYLEGEANAALGVDNQIIPTQDGYYSALITNQDGCSFQTRTVYFVVPKVPVITGEDDIKTDVFSIYPNPSTGIFKVRFPKALTEDMQVSIFDATGKVIKTQIFEKNNQDFVIDIQGMAKGIYLIRFNQDNAIYSKSVILE